jgi:hypothetical protein
MVTGAHLHSVGPCPFCVSFSASPPAYTYVETLPHWEPMWQYLVTQGINLLWHVSLIARHRCPILHRWNPKAHVDVTNGQLKVIKAVLRLSRRPRHALMFKVGSYFQSLTTTKPIIKEALIHLGHWCLAIRFMWRNSINQLGNNESDINLEYL